jgi:hypothetical protein
MEPLRLPSKDEIHTVYEQGEDTVARLFYETFQKLAERIQQMEDRLAKDSSNSRKPPSSDGLAKKPKNLRFSLEKRTQKRSLFSLGPNEQIIPDY